MSRCGCFGAPLAIPKSCAYIGSTICRTTSVEGQIWLFIHPTTSDVTLSLSTFARFVPRLLGALHKASNFGPCQCLLRPQNLAPAAYT
eukprot:2809136-Amphidinium_carterae.1